MDSLYKTTSEKHLKKLTAELGVGSPPLEGPEFLEILGFIFDNTSKAQRYPHKLDNENKRMLMGELDYMDDLGKGLHEVLVMGVEDWVDLIIKSKMCNERIAFLQALRQQSTFDSALEWVKWIRQTNGQYKIPYKPELPKLPSVLENKVSRITNSCSDTYHALLARGFNPCKTYNLPALIVAWPDIKQTDAHYMSAIINILGSHDDDKEKVANIDNYLGSVGKMTRKGGAKILANGTEIFILLDFDCLDVFDTLKKIAEIEDHGLDPQIKFIGIGGQGRHQPGVSLDIENNKLTQKIFDIKLEPLDGYITTKGNKQFWYGVLLGVARSVYFCTTNAVPPYFYHITHQTFIKDVVNSLSITQLDTLV